MTVPLGKPIRWSEMKNADEVLLEIATPDPAVEVEEIKAEIVPALRLFLDAPLVELEDVIGPPSQRNA